MPFNDEANSLGLVVIRKIMPSGTTEAYLNILVTW
jgi:hypothetical protein